MASASQIPKRNLGRQSWSPRPTEATLVVRSEGPMWSSAPTERRGGFRNHPGQRRAAKRLRQRMGGRGGNRSRDHPQRGQQRRTIPQSRMRRDSSLCTREPWGRGCGSPRRPVGPPRNYNGFLSFRGAERRGNPFPFTMDGGSGRRVVGPYGRSTEVPATGRCTQGMASANQISCRNLGRQSWASAPTKGKKGCRNHPSQRRTAERLRRGHEEQARIGAEAIKKGQSPATAWAALSEAESAERVAGQIRVLPDK